MVTQYSDIFDVALSKMSDYDLANLSQDDVYSILSEYLRGACVKFRSCKKLKDRDDDLAEFSVVLDDDEIEILANQIIIGYLDANYIKTQALLKSSLINRHDYHIFSPKNHLEGLNNLHDRLMKENEQLISQYSWANSRLFNSGGGAI